MMIKNPRLKCNLHIHVNCESDIEFEDKKYFSDLDVHLY